MPQEASEKQQAEDTAQQAEDTAQQAEDAAPKAEDAAPKTEDAAPKTEDAAPKTEDAAPKTKAAAQSSGGASDFARAAEQGSQGFFSEFWDFLKTNKKWWLLPIVLVLVLFGILLILAGTGAAPFIYTLF